MTLICWDPATSSLYADTARTRKGNGDDDDVIRHNSLKLHDLTHIELEDEQLIMAASSGCAQESLTLLAAVCDFGIDKAKEHFAVVDNLSNIRRNRKKNLLELAKLLLVTDRRVVVLDTRGGFQDISDRKTPYFSGSGSSPCKLFVKDMGLSIEEGYLLTGMIVPSVGPVYIRAVLDQSAARVVLTELVKPESEIQLSRDVRRALRKLTVPIRDIPTDIPTHHVSRYDGRT